MTCRPFLEYIGETIEVITAPVPEDAHAFVGEADVQQVHRNLGNGPGCSVGDRQRGEPLPGQIGIGHGDDEVAAHYAVVAPEQVALHIEKVDRRGRSVDHGGRQLGARTDDVQHRLVGVGAEERVVILRRVHALGAVWDTIPLAHEGEELLRVLAHR